MSKDKDNQNTEKKVLDRRDFMKRGALAAASVAGAPAEPACSRPNTRTAPASPGSTASRCARFTPPSGGLTRVTTTNPTNHTNKKQKEHK